MEDTSMDVVEEKSASNNGADSASKDDDDDVEPPVMQLNPLRLWIKKLLHWLFVSLFSVINLKLRLLFISCQCDEMIILKVLKLA